MKKSETTNYVGYVYLIYNNLNDKVYIGETINTLEKRFKLHINAATNYKSSIYNNKLYRAMRKYGTSNFFIKELDRIVGEDKKKVKDEIQDLEVLYIKKYDSFMNGYNSDSGGRGGKIIDEESRKKMSIIKKNDPKTKDRLKYARSFNHSERKIVMYNFNSGEKLAEYESIKAASLELNIDGSSITKCCKGKSLYRTINNIKVTFRYIEDVYIPEYTVELYTDCGLINEKFVLAADGAKKYDIDPSSVIRCCKGKCNYAGIFKGILLKWRYIK